jgi:hypothetical protein
MFAYLAGRRGPVIVVAVLSAAVCAKTGARFGTVGFFDGP